MQQQTLSGAWQMRELNSDDWLPAVVPGGTFVDLLAAGKIPDPFSEMNEPAVQWAAERDWEYQRTFVVDPTLLQEEQVELACLGLDTLAEITLNGQWLGKTNNMFRTFRWQVKEWLQPGENTLSILFRSPVNYVKERQAARKLPSSMAPGIAHLRKAQSHFGWDWGPVLPVSGIWRDIRLEANSTAKFADLHLRQLHEDGAVTLSAEVMLQSWDTDAALTLQLTLTAPDGSQQQTETPLSAAAGTQSIELPVKNPQRWWPNGLGAQPLYQVCLRLLNAGQLLDEQTFQVGLRTLELRQEEDEWGNTFTFVVNDVPVFVRGANWIPADSFPTRMTRARYAQLIGDAAAANMNMLRVWGGGYYEEEDFYDLCDQHGILVWQDFMFACAPYPLDEHAFLDNVRAEVTENVRRLRHRASLALWCGNNEIEMMWGLWKRHKSLTQAFEQFFYHQLPEQVNALDPDRAYWPSSPSSGKFLQQTNSDAYGDTHLWQVWHGLKPFTYYRKRFTRIASEFGLEGLPALETFRDFTAQTDLAIDAKVVLHHQRSAGGNDKILYYLTDRFRLPRDFSDLIYVSQLSQAEAMRIGIEHWRRNRPRCSGALYWQLNDCWPVTSWASVDYFGRWKALQYAAKRFNAPLALSLKEEGSTVRPFVVNETPTAWSGRLQWALETLQGDIIRSGSEPVTVSAAAVAKLQVFNFSAEQRAYGKDNLVFIASLHEGKQRLAWQTVLFTKERKIEFPDPQLKSSLAEENGRVLISLTANALARFVWLEVEGADVIFSDNAFDVPAGWTVQVDCPLPDGWDLARFEQALRVRSLVDVVPAGTRFSDWLLHLRCGLKPVSLITRLIFSFLE